MNSIPPPPPWNHQYFEDFFFFFFFFLGGGGGNKFVGCPWEFYHKFMYIAPSGDHSLLILSLSIKVILRKCEVVFWYLDWECCTFQMIDENSFKIQIHQYYTIVALTLATCVVRAIVAWANIMKSTVHWPVGVVRAGCSRARVPVSWAAPPTSLVAPPARCCRGPGSRAWRGTTVTRVRPWAGSHVAPWRSGLTY